MNSLYDCDISYCNEYKIDFVTLKSDKYFGNVRHQKRHLGNIKNNAFTSPIFSYSALF